MKNQRIHLTDFLVTAFSFSMLLLTGNSVAQQAEPGNNRSIDSNKARVVEYWTSERRASAIPRDLVIDARGLGYLRKPDGSLEPYGHQVAAENAANSPSPNARPSGGVSDTTPPDITGMNPMDGATIGAVQTFSAVVTDAASGVKSVSFTIRYPNGSTTQTFNANAGTDGTWSVTLQGFSDGSWSWWVVAKDTAKRGGNTATSAIFNFTVDTGGSGGPGGNGDTVTNGTWATDSAVRNAAGRIFFEMPRNSKLKGPWNGFVCSGTVATDGPNNNRSVIITAAHCVYDDVNKAFARNILFIPNQHDTAGSGTDSNCGNDPIGCWAPTFGAVDVNWTTRTFPDNIPWDYAYYAVDDTGAHEPGLNSSSDALDAAAGSLMVSFADVSVDDGVVGATSPDFTHALGYSFSDDPNFKYCAEDMTIEGTANWWLPSCALSGGSSGGPWVQPMSSGSGPIISINSWGFTGSPGMAGPKLVGTSASCVFDMAKSDSSVSSSASDGQAGIAVTCPPTQ